jgi:hypothetical protein
VCRIFSNAIRRIEFSTAFFRRECTRAKCEARESAQYFRQQPIRVLELGIQDWRSWPILVFFHPMKNLIQNSFVVFMLGMATIAFGAVPSMNVTVSDSSGKSAYKGATDAKGTFATGTLKPGGYVVQFNSKSAPKGAKYAVVVSAGNKKVTANAVDAEKLAAGGVAMKIDVGAGLNITGQKTGSNLSAHWAESDSAEAKEAMTSGNMSRQELQNRQSQGIAPVAR